MDAPRPSYSASEAYGRFLSLLQTRKLAYGDYVPPSEVRKIARIAGMDNAGIARVTSGLSSSQLGKGWNIQPINAVVAAAKAEADADAKEATAQAAAKEAAAKEAAAESSWVRSQMDAAKASTPSAPTVAASVIKVPAVIPAAVQAVAPAPGMTRDQVIAYLNSAPSNVQAYVASHLSSSYNSGGFVPSRFLFVGGTRA